MDIETIEGIEVLNVSKIKQTSLCHWVYTTQEDGLALVDKGYKWSLKKQAYWKPVEGRGDTAQQPSPVALVTAPESDLLARIEELESDLAHARRMWDEAENGGNAVLMDYLEHETARNLAAVLFDRRQREISFDEMLERVGRLLVSDGYGDNGDRLVDGEWEGDGNPEPVQPPEPSAPRQDTSIVEKPVEIVDNSQESQAEPLTLEQAVEKSIAELGYIDQEKIAEWVGA